MRDLGLPITIVRPAPFIELLTEKKFFPPLAAWGAQIRILGWDASIPWVAVNDIGLTIANIFENPAAWIGQDVSVFGDVKTMRQCQGIFTKVNGKKPFRLPLPLGLFQKMAGEEFVLMWRWLDELVKTEGEESLRQILEDSRRINPEMLDMPGWLKMKRNGAME